MTAKSPDLGSSAVEVVPLFEEIVSVGKREVEQGCVCVSVHDEEQILEEVLRHQTVDIERVAINHSVETIPAPRNEGSLLIIPIVCDEVVVTKRYMLKERFRIHLREEVRQQRISVTLKSEEAEIERTSASSTPDRTRLHPTLP